MKSYINILSVVAGMFVLAANASTTIQRCTSDESARYGATHVVNVDWSDLASCTTSNQTIAFTNTVSQPCSVRFMAYQLDSAFASSTITNATFNMALSFGDTNSTARWISGVQAAWNQTPTIYGSFGTDYTVSGGSNTASTLTSPLLNVQTSDVPLVATVAQSGAGSYPMSNLTSGHARFFVRILGKNYRR